MRIPNKYYLISFITLIVVFIINLFFQIFYEAALEGTLYWTQLGCLAVELFCVIDCLRKNRNSLFMQIQAGAIICFMLGLIFWNVHLSVLGYDNQTISISDLSSAGFYYFFLSGIYGILDKNIDNKSAGILKYKLIAASAPILAVTSGIVQYLFIIEHSFGNIMFVILYTTVFMPLSYFSFKNMIVPSAGSAAIKAMKPYNTVIFLLVILNIVWNIISFIGHGLIFNLSVFLASMMMLMIVPTAYGGAKKCKLY